METPHQLSLMILKELFSHVLIPSKDADRPIISLDGHASWEIFLFWRWTGLITAPQVSWISLRICLCLINLYSPWITLLSFNFPWKVSSIIWVNPFPCSLSFPDLRLPMKLVLDLPSVYISPSHILLTQFYMIVLLLCFLEFIFNFLNS